MAMYLLGRKGASGKLRIPDRFSVRSVLDQFKEFPSFVFTFWGGSLSGSISLDNSFNRACQFSKFTVARQHLSMCSFDKENPEDFQS
jgi:hypothetical protein